MAGIAAGEEMRSAVSGKGEANARQTRGILLRRAGLLKHRLQRTHFERRLWRRWARGGVGWDGMGRLVGNGSSEVR